MARTLLIVAAAATLACGLPALAGEPTALTTRIDNHRFTPSEIHVPANTPVALTVINADRTPEEFDSPSLKVEKVVAGGSSGIVRLRPLKPGRYPFTGEYHAETAFGAVVAQ